MNDPKDIIKNSFYRSNIPQLDGYIYMGVAEYDNPNNKSLIIIGESGFNDSGNIIPNDTNNPIWKEGFTKIDARLLIKTEIE